MSRTRDAMNTVRLKVRSGAWSALYWLVAWTIVLGAIASIYFFGFWKTFVGASLVAIMLQIHGASSRFASLAQEIELTQDLVRGPPQMRRIRATDVKPGMYLSGRYLIDFVGTIEENGKVMVGTEGADSPSFHDPEEMVEVTDRSLLGFESGHNEY